MYALCAFIMGYYWNAIWLDTVALLPLVVLGTLQLLREKKYLLYTASLALAVLCSYYIGLFVCIFVFLLFVGYNFVNWDDFAGFRSRLWRIAFFTVIALGIGAVVTGPSLIGLSNTSSMDNEFPDHFSVNIAKQATFAGVLDALRQIIANSAALIEPTSMEGLPNIYCGVITVLLSLIYFCCRHVNWREKLFAGLLLLFLALSFVIRSLDYVWHGFHFPNMLPYRFSFLFSFVLLYMAYRAYTQMDRFRMRYLLLILPALLVFFYCVISADSVVSCIMTAALVLIGASALLLWGRRMITRNVLALILCACLLLEAGCSAVLGVEVVNTTDGTDYPHQASDTQAVVAQMNEREADTPDIWRAELTSKQTLNDSTFFSLPGVSVFASTCNSGVSNFMCAIGLAASARGNRYVYEQSDPAVNLILNLKYLIDRDGQNSDPTHLTQAAESNGVLLLENRDYLPMGWAVDPQILQYEAVQQGSPFVQLESLYSKLTGSSVHLYNTAAVDSVSYEGGASGSAGGLNKFTFRSDGQEDSRICIRFIKRGSGGMSLYTKSQSAGNLYLYVNEVYRCSYDDHYGQLHYFDGLKNGDVITLRYRAKEADKDASVTVYAADFDEAAYQDARGQLSEQVFAVESRSDTEITGTILCQNESVFFTTIPYDSGWSAEVDGEQVRIHPVANAFVAFPLPAGSHEIRLQYQTPGLSVSTIVSLCAVVLFLLFVVLYLIFRLTKRPMAKIELAMDGMPPDEGLELLPQEILPPSPRVTPSPAQSMPPLVQPPEKDEQFESLFDDTP